MSNRVCIRNNTEELNIHVCIHESKVLTKDISCECKYKFHSKKCNSDQWWNNDIHQCDCKNIIYVKKIIFGILSNDAETKTVPTSFDEKNITCKTQHFYIYLSFY